MMKTFKEYLVESVKDWSFRIKIGGLDEAPDADLLETIFEKYGLKSLSTFKKTPIQEHPVDFYNLRNSDVYIADASFDYPVTANELFYYIQENTDLLGSQLVVVSSSDKEEIAREEMAQKGEEVYQPLLDSEYSQESFPIEYGDEYNQSMLAELETRKYEIEGGSAPTAKTTNDDKVHTASPMKDMGNHSLGKR